MRRKPQLDKPEPNCDNPLYLVLDYKLPLAQLREFLCLTGNAQSDEDVVDFFQRMISNYFLEREGSDARYDLYEVCMAERDAFEVASNLPEMVNEIFETIDEITRKYLPHYNLLSCGYGIEDCQPRGKSSTFVIELNRDFLP